MILFKTRNYNLDAALKAFLLLGFAFFFFLTIQSGEVLKYVHPRNVPVIVFAIVAMLICAVFLFLEAMKPKRINQRAMPLLFFALPLVMAFLLPAQSVNSATLSYEDVSVGGRLGDSSAAQGNSYSGNGGYSDGEASYDEEAFYKETYSDTYSEDSNMSTQDVNGANTAISGEDEFPINNGTVIVDSENYVRWMEELFNNLDQYKGKKIEVTGFVYKDDQFGENEFVSARMMMVCCAADMQTVGFLCKYNGSPELTADSWIKVTGTIEEGEFEGSKMTVIEVDQIENTEKPENEYVYPY